MIYVQCTWMHQIQGYNIGQKVKVLTLMNNRREIYSKSSRTSTIKAILKHHPIGFPTTQVDHMRYRECEHTTSKMRVKLEQPENSMWALLKRPPGLRSRPHQKRSRKRVKSVISHRPPLRTQVRHLCIIKYANHNLISI